ncbi:T9SS type A sorting domain-containing protein [bacterium]|nr:T9SS type A sorting domain-containing protein [bacterium]
MKLVIALVIVCGSVWAQCPGGNALRFTGECWTGNYVTIPNSPELSEFSQITVECWFKQLAPVPCYEENIFNKSNSVYDAGTIQLFVSNSCCDWNGAHLTFGFHQSDIEGYWADWPHDLTLNEWHHIAGVWDGSFVTLFIDGELAASTPMSISGTVGNVVSGAYLNHHAWTGGESERLSAIIDEFRISAVARYLTNFNPPNEKFIPDENTVLLYHFDESNGSTVHDASSNAIHGSTINNPQWICSDASLPVELLSFSAIARDESVVLSWVTGAESEMSHFEIERDGAVVANVQATNRATGNRYQWRDEALENGREYVYTLTSVDLDGSREQVGQVSATPRANEVPSEFMLLQNYPNPFNASTTIEFLLPEVSDVTLTLHNLLGEEVATLSSGVMSAGVHRVNFDAGELSSGIYFYRLQAGEKMMQKKMAVVR